MEQPQHTNSKTAPAPVTGLPDIRPVGPGAPFIWLAAGWRDLAAHPGIGLFYGICFCGMGWALLWAFENSPQSLLILAGGFLLIGPFLAMGCYQVSLCRERGQPTSLASSLTAWDANFGALALYLGVLLVLEMLWSRTALVVFAVSFNTMPDTHSTLHLLLDPANRGFLLAYIAVGAVFASLIFLSSVISIPMILDRNTDGITAGITSWRACFTRPGTTLIWGALITLLVVAAMLPWFLGLIVVGPWIGHASWHAYRGLVAPDRPAE